MSKRRVVITGLGMISPLGVGNEATWQGLVEGRSGIGPITKFDASAYACRIAGEVKGFDPEDRQERAQLLIAHVAEQLAEDVFESDHDSVLSAECWVLSYASRPR